MAESMSPQRRTFVVFLQKIIAPAKERPLPYLNKCYVRRSDFDGKSCKSAINFTVKVNTVELLFIVPVFTAITLTFHVVHFPFAGLATSS